VGLSAHIAWYGGWLRALDRRRKVVVSPEHARTLTLIAFRNQLFHIWLRRPDRPSIRRPTGRLPDYRAVSSGSSARCEVSKFSSRWPSISYRLASFAPSTSSPNSSSRSTSKLNADARRSNRSAPPTESVLEKFLSQTPPNGI